MTTLYGKGEEMQANKRNIKCPKRKVGCHSKCKEYQEFVKYNEKKRKDMKLADSYYSGETNWNYSHGDKKHGNR